VCWTPPALCGGRLYVRNKVHAACVHLGPPEALTEEQRSRRVAVAVGAEASAPLLDPAWAGPALYAPTVGEMLWWYAACVFGVLFPSAVIAWVVSALGARRAARWVFWAVLALGGGGGTAAFSAAAGKFVFTWPVSLFAAYQGMLTVATWARGGRRARGWLARGAVLAFAALCWGYYVLCRSLFIVMGYGFLVGFLPAFPAAIWAARGMRRGMGLRGHAAWALGVFSVHFWASAAFILWRT
jgi:hypothetical protein